ncbi:hypothetical protein [Desulfoscipio gibsoniae]|uniref:DUF2292 domain-containing protein n=1 Tax=Desulfoscipio gibsoniae DSM 7213 TaxID=767817 RepID=R4KTU2_9FIRM|nr:hypothetical protein [Desulfoscipio gibsoniae]AGL03006.1 hypothetical protein Desgi_3684 [Desulfoscipio gibsoniae DSM 7213]
MHRDTGNTKNLSHREKQLIIFIRQLGWGEIRIRVENGQPVLIYEAIKTFRLEDDPVSVPVRKKPKGIPANRVLT